MNLTILYDNCALDGFNSGWAFSCLLESCGKTLLFDTAWDSYRLIENMRRLGIGLDDIDAIFISHNHWDHVGSLAYLLNMMDEIPVFVPSSFPKHLKGEIGKRAKLVEIKDACEIMEGFHSTGGLGSDIMEQSLVVKAEKGNVVVCGCSHPGVERILERARTFGEVYGIVGGLHDFNNLEALGGLKLIIPCHCTQKKSELMGMYPDICKEGKAGAVFEL